MCENNAHFVFFIKRCVSFFKLCTFRFAVIRAVAVVQENKIQTPILRLSHVADNECLGNSFSMGTIYWYICGRVCRDIDKRHPKLIQLYRYRIFRKELHRLLCANLGQRSYQLDIICYH